MLGQLLLERPLDQPAGQLAQHAVLPEDLALASLAGDQLAEHPVQQPLAQLRRAARRPSARAISNHRLGQLPTLRLGQLPDRVPQPRLLQTPR